MFLRAVPALILCASLVAGEEDPLAAPPELQAFARHATAMQPLAKGKLQHLLDAIFRPVEDGGLGMTYDNSHTRTVAEVWRDRKANCLSLTAFYIAACDTIGIRAHYAEALNTNRWRRVGPVIRFERHLVALVPMLPNEDVVADFLPQLRRRIGVYRVAILSPERVRALFFANRAVELLEEGNLSQALETAQASLRTDPGNSVGWNIYGVVLKSQGDPEAAGKAFRRALVCDPRDSSAIGNMEALMREQGQLDEALHYRVLGQDVRKKDPFFHAFLAEEAMAAGDLEEAQKRIKTAIKLLPHESEFLLTQARLHIQQGKADLAVKDLEEAQRWSVPEERERYDSKLAAIREQQKGQDGKGKPD
jgi:Flp pilus assembly protein TadD